jgi:hypothetical protein
MGITHFGPSVDDQAVSLSDDGTTIIIDFFSFLFFSTAIQLVTLSTCILIRINHATRQEPVCTNILPTAAWLFVDWQTGFNDTHANGGPHSGTPILFFIVGFPPKIFYGDLK